MTVPRPPADDEITLLELWRILFDGRWHLIGFTFAAGMAAALASLLMTPAYRAEAVIQEMTTESAAGAGMQSLLGQFGGLAELAGVNLPSVGTGPGTGRTILQSRTLVEEFLSRNDLLHELYADDWDADGKKWKTERAPTIWQAAKDFKEDVLRLDRDEEYGLIIVGVEWRDPEVAADWANRLVALVNELSRQSDIAAAEKSIKFLNEQIAQTNIVELQRVLYNLVEVELRTLLLANAREDYAFRVVDRAVPPIYRSKPRRTLITAAGLVLGGFLGLVFVLSRGVPRALRQKREASR